MPCSRSFSVFLLAIFTQMCGPCSVVNWQPMTLCEQASEAEIIVYGTIKAHYPIPDFPYNSAYIAEMEVNCTLKGEELPAKINISEAGELTSCDHTLLPVDGRYITFLRRKEGAAGLLVPDEVNHLSVAFEPTPLNFKQVGRAVGDAGRRCSQLGDLVYSTGVWGDNDSPEGGYGGGAGDCGDGAAALSYSTLCFVTMAIVPWL